jgi:beta-glucosidase
MKLIEQMTLEEKIGLLHGDGFFQTKGVKRLGIPPLKMSDGPMGVRHDFPKASWIAKGLSSDYVTYFPSNTALAATWNPELAYIFGQDLGAETRGRGKDVILAPGINIIRHPFCGRNFEYMSEDPFLITKMAPPIVRGIQENDVAACVKHFALNNQETNRLEVNVEVDDQALEEIYLPGFKACVDEGNAYTFMGAYNKFRGDYACESTFLLQDILRGRWGYDGIVISDWGACHSTDQAMEAGLDIEMSVTDDFDSYYYADSLYQKVMDGIIDEALVDEKVERILHLMERIHMLEGPRKQGKYNSYEHQTNTLTTAEESIVLLENKASFLPLNPEDYQRIVVIGDNANRQHSLGGGSAEIKALYEKTPLAGIHHYLGGNHQITYVQGYSCQPDVTQDQQSNLRMTALRMASQNDLVIFVGGLNHDFDTEGKDRQSYQLPFGQDRLIQELHAVNPNLLVVNMSGSAVDLTIAKTYSKALIHTWYNGMEGGTALANVLFGKVNPSGKLPFTMAKALNDYPSERLGEFPGDETVHYHEGVFVGYRYFDYEQIEPLYAFGHGLNYSQFALADIEKTENEETFTFTMTLKNTSTVDGKEVIQVYVEDEEPKGKRPIRELKGFKKVFVAAKSEESVTITIDKKDIAHLSQKLKFHFGFSSRDIKMII